ncbi:MAG: DUF3879 family protein [Gracilibacteraceae bacterium]|jgi:hypothetical protein|nr:DUF3879 family protein [Gracilibacteraceae bacterium]
MRISEVSKISKGNYTYFLQMLGVKNPKAADLLGDLDKLPDKDAFGNPIIRNALGEETHESQIARLTKEGIIEEGMFLREGQTMEQRVMNIPDEVREKAIELARYNIVTNHNGTTPANTSKTDKFWEYIKEVRQNYKPADRQAFTWTVSQVMREESLRITDYIKKVDPGWRVGVSFDPKILTETNYGLNAIDMLV